MHIAIKYSFSAFNVLFINLCNVLLKNDCFVTFLNPPIHIAKAVRKYTNADICSYDQKNCESIIRNLKIDKFVCWNGLYDQQEVSVFRKLDVECWFCENGYLDDTFQLSKDGINAQAEYADFELDKILEFKYNKIRSKPIYKNEIVSSFPSFSLWYLIGKIKNPSRLFESIIEISRYKNRRKTRLKGIGNRSHHLIQKDFIFFPLQVNRDTQIVQNSRFYGMIDALNQLVPEIRESLYSLVIREHPDEVERLPYSAYVDNIRIFIENYTSLNELIDQSEFVLTINSSVGFKALERGKNVVLLGRAFYTSHPGVFCVTEMNERLDEVFKMASACKVSSKLNKRFIEHFRDNIFIKGNWSNPSSEFLEECAGRLLG